MEPGVYAHFDTTEGSFTIRLFEKEAPVTVANFVGLAEGSKEWKDPVTGENKKAPFYDGVVFHRVINGFMIQGGDRLGQGTGGPGTSSPTNSTPRSDTTAPASCRWPTRDRTRTGASSSSRSDRHLTSIGVIRSSAQWSKGSMSCGRSEASPRAGRIDPFLRS